MPGRVGWVWEDAWRMAWLLVTWLLVAWLLVVWLLVTWLLVTWLLMIWLLVNQRALPGTKLGMGGWWC